MQLKKGKQFNLNLFNDFKITFGTVDNKNPKALYFTITYNKHNKIVFVFVLYFIYIFFISGISSTQGDRFHIVFYPIVLLLLLFFLKNIKNITNKYIK